MKITEVIKHCGTLTKKIIPINKCVQALASKYNLNIVGVKNKIKCLRSYFSKEHKICLSKKSGSGTDEIYTSTWFEYKPLLFTKDSLTPKETTEVGLDYSSGASHNTEVGQKVF